MENIRFAYLRDEKNNAFACIAVRLNKKNNTIEYGLSSVNSKHDKFDRETARNIANGRLNSEHDVRVIRFVRFEGVSAHELTRHVMYDIACNASVESYDEFGNLSVIKGAPQRARNAAKVWLLEYVNTRDVSVPVEQTGFEGMTNALESRPSLLVARAVS